MHGQLRPRIRRQWRETVGDRDAAIRMAEALAESGLVVEVVRKRFGLHSFVTGFPESERDALRARWRVFQLWRGSGDGGTGGSISHHHHHAYNSIGAHGGFGGGHHGGGHASH